LILIAVLRRRQPTYDTEPTPAWTENSTNYFPNNVGSYIATITTFGFLEVHLTANFQQNCSTKTQPPGPVSVADTDVAFFP